MSNISVRFRSSFVLAALLSSSCFADVFQEKPSNVINYDDKSLSSIKNSLENTKKILEDIVISRDKGWLLSKDFTDELVLIVESVLIGGGVCDMLSLGSLDTRNLLRLFIGIQPYLASSLMVYIGLKIIFTRLSRGVKLLPDDVKKTLISLDKLVSSSNITSGHVMSSTGAFPSASVLSDSDLLPIVLRDLQGIKNILIDSKNSQAPFALSKCFKQVLMQGMYFAGSFVLGSSCGRLSIIGMEHLSSFSEDVQLLIVAGVILLSWNISFWVLKQVFEQVLIAEPDFIKNLKEDSCAMHLIDRIIEELNHKIEKIDHAVGETAILS